MGKIITELSHACLREAYVHTGLRVRCARSLRNLRLQYIIGTPDAQRSEFPTVRDFPDDDERAWRNRTPVLPDVAAYLGPLAKGIAPLGLRNVLSRPHAMRRP